MGFGEGNKKQDSLYEVFQTIFVCPKIFPNYNHLWWAPGIVPGQGPLTTGRDEHRPQLRVQR